jgi:hypothetical protein
VKYYSEISRKGWQSQCLPSNHETLSSNSRAAQNEKKSGQTPVPQTQKIIYYAGWGSFSGTVLVYKHTALDSNFQHHQKKKKQTNIHNILSTKGKEAVHNYDPNSIKYIEQ